MDTGHHANKPPRIVPRRPLTSHRFWECAKHVHGPIVVWLEAAPPSPNTSPKQTPRWCRSHAGLRRTTTTRCRQTPIGGHRKLASRKSRDLRRCSCAHLLPCGSFGRHFPHRCPVGPAPAAKAHTDLSWQKTSKRRPDQRLRADTERGGRSLWSSKTRKTRLSKPACGRADERLCCRWLALPSHLYRSCAKQRDPHLIRVM